MDKEEIEAEDPEQTHCSVCGKPAWLCQGHSEQEHSKWSILLAIAQPFFARIKGRFLRWMRR